MPDLVVHCKRDRFDVYVGRPGPFGNPYSFKAGTRAQFILPTREEALDAYHGWLMSNWDLQQRVILELKGKVLGCWCAPKGGFNGRLLCHAQHLAALANGMHFSEVAK